MNTLLADITSPSPAAAETEAVNFLEFNKAIWNESPEVCDPGDLVCEIGVVMRNITSEGRIEGFETPGAIISEVYPYLFTMAGLILFVMLIWGGFQIMMGASDPKAADAGKKRITSALIGFTILFCAYWIAQIVQYVFGINIGVGGPAGGSTIPPLVGVPFPRCPIPKMSNYPQLSSIMQYL